MVRGDTSDRTVVAEPRSSVSSSTRPVVPALSLDRAEADQDPGACGLSYPPSVRPDGFESPDDVAFSPST